MVDLTAGQEIAQRIEPGSVVVVDPGTVHSLRADTRLVNVGGPLSGGHHDVPAGGTDGLEVGELPANRGRGHRCGHGHLVSVAGERVRVVYKPGGDRFQGGAFRFQALGRRLPPGPGRDAPRTIRRSPLADRVAATATIGKWGTIPQEASLRTRSAGEVRQGATHYR